MIARAYEISCDDCGELFDDADVNLQPLRIRARVAGWISKASGDQCPDCRVKYTTGIWSRQEAAG